MSIGLSHISASSSIQAQPKVYLSFNMNNNNNYYNYKVNCGQFYPGKHHPIF